MTEPPVVTNNTEESRYEVSADGALAELIYRRRGNRLILVHTGVPDAMGGKGIGGLLVQTALDDAAAEGLTIVPLCPFARNWLERHPDAAAGASIDWGQAAGH